MPLVGNRRLRENPGAAGEMAVRAGGLFPRCANPRCSTGWMRLWRSRRVPGFEGRWACSAECMGELVATALRREMDAGDRVAAPHAHRIPMGLLLVEQGRITPGELREALDGQRRAAEESGERVRLGEWLLGSGVLSEPALTRALSAQWNCPVFSLANYRAAPVAGAMPHFLSEAAGAVPVRVAAGRLLYVAFADRIDRSLTYALERMTGLRVEAGIAPGSEFRAAQERFLAAAAPRSRCLEAAGSGVLARSITQRIEAARPLEARLVRMHDYYWLRMWRSPAVQPGVAAPDEVEDLLATIGRAGRGTGPGAGPGRPGAE